MRGAAPGERRGGRAKGVKNKLTQAIQAEIAEMRQKASEDGMTPLDYMLRVMRDEMADSDRRDRMAAACAPYIHPKLQNIELGNANKEPFKIVLQSADEGVL